MAEPETHNPGLAPLTSVSRFPPPKTAMDARFETAIRRLELELERATTDERRARILFQIADLEERGGAELEAATHYLAAFNQAPQFREPLESLLSLLERRHSVSNLGRVYEALLREADTADERARARIVFGAFLEDELSDLPRARELFVEATTEDASSVERDTAWAMVEAIAAKLDERGLREEALEKRAEAAADPEWRSLLLLDLARLHAARGETPRALAHLAVAKALGSPAQHAVLSEEARMVGESLGDPASHLALAELLTTIASLESQHEAEGIPARRRSDAALFDSFLRAALHWERGGDARRAAETLDRARAHAGGSDAKTWVLDMARLRLADTLSEAKLSRELSEKLFEQFPTSPFSVSFAVRAADDLSPSAAWEKAVAWLLRGLEVQPGSAGAIAILWDTLLREKEWQRLAELFANVGQRVAHAETKCSLFLAAAWIANMHGGGANLAKSWLEKAVQAGTPDATVSLLVRAMSVLQEDREGYAQHTRALFERTAHPDDTLSFGLEILRNNLRTRDSEAWKATLDKLALTHSWIAQALFTFLPATGELSQRLSALSALAKEEPQHPLALRLLSLLLEQRAPAPPTSTELGSEGNFFALALEAARFEAKGAGKEAAEKLHRLSLVAENEETSASLLLEAALNYWKGGNRLSGLRALEDARGVESATQHILPWAYAVDAPGTLEGHRRVLEEDSARDAAHFLERWALEMKSGDLPRAVDALRDAGASANTPLQKRAVALGTVLFAPALADPALAESALGILRDGGAEAQTLAAREETYLAPTNSVQAAGLARQWYTLGGGLAAALEWLSCAMCAGESTEAAPARRALIENLPELSSEKLSLWRKRCEWLENEAAPPEPFSSPRGAQALFNLELAPTGTDPLRRGRALAELGPALGEASELDAKTLAGWCRLAAGSPVAARRIFEDILAHRPDDLAVLEGLRSALELLDEKSALAAVTERVGLQCLAPARSAEFLERAGLLFLELGDTDGGERAFEQAFSRDPSRAVAFDRLFRIVRDKKDPNRILVLIERRHVHSEDPDELVKLYWERARALRELGDSDGALEALTHVTMLESDHVGALALTGEIAIRKGRFADAAEALTRLATLGNAPPKTRVTAGVTAVDLLENKLDDPSRALQVLLSLHAEGLTTLPVRERLAKVAAKNGAWNEATRILEELMKERPDSSGRVDAARLAMLIYRDKLLTPERALSAVQKVLEELPKDSEAIDMLIGTDGFGSARRRLLVSAKDAMLSSFADTPPTREEALRLTRAAHTVADTDVARAAFSVAKALGAKESEAPSGLVRTREPTVPLVAFTPEHLGELVAPGDGGPLADLFSVLGSTLGEAFGPSLASCGVTKKDRVDARSGLLLRDELAAWAGAFGVSEFELYVGGPHAHGITGIAAETPALVVGTSVKAPLGPRECALVARELFALVRGTSLFLHRDEITAASVFVAACRLAEVHAPHAEYAILADVQKQLTKAISRKVKKRLPELCQAALHEGRDARTFHRHALMTLDRAALVAVGDLRTVLEALSLEKTKESASSPPMRERNAALFRFALGKGYRELRTFLLEQGGP